jgi:O-antigen/teichoic acid export membrane protein
MGRTQCRSGADLSRPGGLAGSALSRLRSSQFIRQVSETYLTQVSVIALSFVNSIVVTRLLGPEGRGLFAAANTLTAVECSSALSAFTRPTPTTSPASRARSRPAREQLRRHGRLRARRPGRLRGPPVASEPRPSRALLALAFAAIPIGLAYLLLQNLLIATQRVRTYNIIDLTTRVLAVGLVAATAPLGIVSPESVFGLVLATVVIGLVWAFPKLGSLRGGRMRWSAETLRRGLRYGLRAYTGSLFSFLVLKSDILVVTYLRGAEETGYYAIAVGLADILLMFPVVVGTLLFPRLSGLATCASAGR